MKFSKRALSYDLTVWKKNAAGQWKFIADTGNDGLGK